MLITAAVALTALLVSGFAFLLTDRRAYDRTRMEFEALQAAAALAEYFARSGPPGESVIPDRVLGLGIYDGGGRARVQLGTAPAALPEAAAARAPVSRLDRAGGTLTLLRPLGAPRAPRGPMDRMPDGFDDHGMGPRGGMDRSRMPGHGMMDRSAPPAPATPSLGDAAYLLLEYDVSHIIAATRRRLLSWSSLGFALVLLLAVVSLLIRRLRRYEEDRRRREHLVQLGEAARTLAHEIRNPLGAIRLQTAMLRKHLAQGTAAGAAAPGAGRSATPAPAAAPDHQLDILDEEVGRIDALVNEVREFLQDPRGTPESIDLVSLLETVPRRFSFPVAVRIEAEGLCEVSFDRNRLHSVLANVLRNAAEAGPEGKAVELELTRRRDRLVVGVADRGPGLPDDADGDRIFDPFYTRKVGGFGVGLAVSRRFVEAAGGTIRLRNRSDGPGAECIIELAEVHRNARSDR